LEVGDLTFGRWGCRQRISADRESITVVTTIDAAR
jgi:TraM recognition site of TraD and TraG